MTTWSLLVGLIYVLWQLIPELTPIRENVDLIAYTIQLYSYMQITVILTIDIFRTSWQPSKIGQFGFRVSLTDEINISLLRFIALVILGIFLPLAGLHYSNAHFSNPYRSWLSIQGMIDIGILLPFFVLVVIVLSGLKIYQNKTGYPSPISLVAQGKSASSLNLYLFFPITVLLWMGNAVCVYLVLQSLPADSAGQVLRVSIDSMLVTLILLILLTSTRSDRTSERLEALERDIVLHNLEQDKIRERIQDELLGYEAGEWLRNKVSQVRQKAEQIRDVTGKAVELKQTILEINPEFTHEQLGRVADYTSRLKKLTIEYNDDFDRLGKWINFNIQMVRIYKDSSLTNLFNDVYRSLSEVHEGISRDVNIAVHEVEAAIKEVNAKRQKIGLPTFTIASSAKPA